MADRLAYVADRAGFCIIQYGMPGVEESKVSGPVMADARILSAVTRNAITLELSPSTQSQVAILDVTGRTRLTSNFGPRAAGQDKVRLDVSDLPTGVYFVKLSDESERRVSKIVLTR